MGWKMRSGRFVPSSRTVAVLLGSLALLYFAFVVTLANVAATDSPRTVLKFYPWHSTSLAASAFATLTTAKKPADLIKAKAEAQRALERDPLAVPAIRTLALIAEAERDPVRATRLMDYSLRASRRDLLTHSWFIEKSVTANDVPAALVHYDMALRTSNGAFDLLLPILVRAVEADGILRPLASLLNSGPPWGRRYADALVTSPVVSEKAAALVLMVPREDVFGWPQRNGLATKLVLEEKFKLASALMGRRLTGPLNSDDLLGLDPKRGPFSWALKQDYGLTAELHDREGNDRALTVRAGREKGGEVARTLLTLEPGRYRLTTRAEGIGKDPMLQPFWRVECAGRAPIRIGEFNVGGKQSQASFDVPETCAGQWLILSARAPEVQDGLAFTVVDVRMSPL
jgi:hypothetical protein